ncbi:ABC transporter ATP-binding protein [Roseibacterium sp. SDUM158017]|uniref:ABC transporter ATP-binding protein n=1 Tax=Roseicyclus salinarum TaxID=3036773 RepID=UPI0024158918|nr:ABC transporter ATP-binding protein [Roseibacterium sp. SDUM158017]MDG4647005.1 ABC transporter ATP-binding protein [Roseibacterium sp. SDUM158017]
MTHLSLDRLTVRRGECPVVDCASLEMRGGELVGLIGPNGAGKTSLMRGALGLLPARGTSSLASLSPADRARHVAWLPQSREIAWPVPVRTLVMLGRVPYLAGGQRPRPEDEDAVSEALNATDLAAFGDRPATELSGGEQARVLIARALAQETPLILADEPTAGLDPGHQIATLARFSAMARGGKSILASLHDLGLAARHCDRLILMNRGRIEADGAPDDVLSPERLRDVFGIRAHLSRGPDGLVFQPLEVIA